MELQSSASFTWYKEWTKLDTDIDPWQDEIFTSEVLPFY